MSKSTEIDWEAFSQKVKSASREAVNETNAELAGEMSSIVHLTQKEILDIFPEKSEMEDFAELMKIVKSSTNTNQKVTKIVQNSENFSKVVVSLLSKII